MASAATAAARSASQISFLPSNAGAVSQNSSRLLRNWPSVSGTSDFHRIVSWQSDWFFLSAPKTKAKWVHRTVSTVTIRRPHTGIRPRHCPGGFFYGPASASSDSDATTHCNHILRWPIQQFLTKKILTNNIFIACPLLSKDSCTCSVTALNTDLKRTEEQIQFLY